MKRFNIEIKHPRWQDDGTWLEEKESATGEWVSAKDALPLETRVKELEACLLTAKNSAIEGEVTVMKLEAQLAALRLRSNP